MCSRRSSMPWRAPSWPTMGEIGPPGSRLTCPQRYDIVALLRSEEDATMKPRRPQPSLKRKRLDSREEKVITSMEMPRGLQRQARIAAHDLNWNLTEVHLEAVQEWVVGHSN